MISIDTKKKEISGNSKNNGKEWTPKGAPRAVKVHDFIDKQLGKVIPYGVYDLAKNKGFVSVGIDKDTGEFAVQTIRRWWNGIGREAYPHSSHLYITADGGGSNAKSNHTRVAQCRAKSPRASRGPLYERGRFLPPFDKGGLGGISHSQSRSAPMSCGPI